jgi:hypothetical protein
MSETFVFNESEVRKTGRIATKPMLGNKVLTLVEITPINEFDGTWKKFVSESALLTIIDTTEVKK